MLKRKVSSIPKQITNFCWMKTIIQNFLLLDNWSITHLRPSNPLRPCIASSQSNSQLKFELSTKRPQPTYEEDALVLRVIEAYSIAFQNTSRNTIHSGDYKNALFFFICYPFLFNFISGNQKMLCCTQ